MIIFSVIILINLSMSSDVQAQEVIGFIDQNTDGINDLFVDTNGDGINDVTGKSYPHAFKYVDGDKDNRNDLWADSDGDGVNDKLGEFQKKSMQWIDLDGDGIIDSEAGGLKGKALKAHVLDINKDGKNDITGERYSGRDLQGYRFGNVYEEMGITDPDFTDTNGNSMNDNFEKEISIGKHGKDKLDFFIDRNGDGIADDKGLGKIKNRGKQKGKK